VIASYLHPVQFRQSNQINRSFVLQQKVSKLETASLSSFVIVSKALHFNESIVNRLSTHKKHQKSSRARVQHVSPAAFWLRLCLLAICTQFKLPFVSHTKCQHRSPSARTRFNSRSIHSNPLSPPLLHCLCCHSPFRPCTTQRSSIFNCTSPVSAYSILTSGHR
jgi:hypothetical protein